MEGPPWDGDVVGKRRMTVERHSKKLQIGAALVKRCRGSKKHQRWVKVSDDLQELRWGASKDLLEDLVDPKFKSIKSNTILRVQKEGKINGRSFSVSTLNRKLVFEASSDKQMEEWVLALMWLMSQVSTVGIPSNVVHVAHVDGDFNWTGKNLNETFKLVEKLGEGSFGVVYRAVHNELKLEVAVKFVKFSSQDEEQAKALQKEISILRSCSNENVVVYLGCWGPDTKKRLWIITEFCHLGSITDCLHVIKLPLTEGQISFIMASLLRGLAYLHQRKIVHRDIKARNILINKTGIVKLADFGLAKDMSGSISQSVGAVGSPLHMAPEVILGSGPNYKSDIWSLGITAIELAEGKPPHAEKAAYQALAIIPYADPPKLRDKNWSKDFRDFVEQCCIKDPAQRPTATSLLRHKLVSQITSNEALIPLVEAYYSIKPPPTESPTSPKPPEISEHPNNTSQSVARKDHTEESKHSVLASVGFEKRLLQAIEDFEGSESFEEAESLSIGSDDGHGKITVEVKDDGKRTTPKAKLKLSDPSALGSLTGNTSLSQHQLVDPVSKFLAQNRQKPSPRHEAAVASPRSIVAVDDVDSDDVDHPKNIRNTESIDFPEEEASGRYAIDAKHRNLDSGCVGCLIN